MAAPANETAGPIHILVNCADVEIASAYTRYSEAELDGIIRLDLLTPLWLIQALLPGMLARGTGPVVICSLASRGPLSYGMPHAAAKWGLAGATHSLRLEYAGSGVGFSVVIPGFVTGVGIFARHQAAGIAAPAVFGTVLLSWSAGRLSEPFGRGAWAAKAVLLDHLFGDPDRSHQGEVATPG